MQCNFIHRAGGGWILVCQLLLLMSGFQIGIPLPLRTQRLSVGCAGTDSFKDINFHIHSFLYAIFPKNDLSGLPVLLSDVLHSHLYPTFSRRKAYSLSVLNLTLMHCLGV